NTESQSASTDVAAGGGAVVEIASAAGESASGRVKRTSAKMLRAASAGEASCVSSAGVAAARLRECGSREQQRSRQHREHQTFDPFHDILHFPAWGNAHIQPRVNV